MVSKHAPDYIPVSIVGAPLDFKWGGASEHIGPTETMTPLLDRLAGTTTTGQIAMCAGILTWGAWRFHGHLDVGCYLELADAAFAYMIDWRYLNTDITSQRRAPDQPPPVSAMMQLNLFMFRALSRQEFWDSYYQPVRETFHSTHIVRHVVPKTERATFDTWLDQLVDRIKAHWAKPDEAFRKKSTFASPLEREQFIARHRGLPVPQQILDPAFVYVEADRPQLLNDFLSRLQDSGNRYLHPATQMLQLGFQGTPYRVN
jgi:hypothetical protein